MIEIRDISKKYRETFVLRHVSTRLPSDRMVAFIGSNGAGKSTMLNIISRLLEPTEGSVSIDGRELRKWDSRELAKTLTILGQTLHTPARLTVEELVRFGRFPHSRGRLENQDSLQIEKALELTEIADLRHCYLDELSGGQRQMAYIAMAIAQDTKYIFLDEPLNNLDMHRAARIMKLLRSLVREQGKTICIVIHDINFVSFYADYVVAFRDGVLCHQGPTEDIIRTDVLRDIYGMDIAIEPYGDKKICVYYEYNFLKFPKQQTITNNMRTTITAFLAALILPGLSMAAADEAKTITATHTLGTVELPVNPKRVAVLDYGSLETISELGVTPALALPKKFLPPYLSKFSGEQYTDLGTVKEFNIETINAFKPDLIIISGRQQDYYQKLSSIAPVYLVDILAKEQLGEAKKNIRLLGDVFGVPEKAAEAVKNIDEAVTRTKDKAQASGKKALVLLTNDGKVSAYGSGSRFGLVHDALGVAQADKNIKVGVHGQQVTYEYVAMLNPDIIFVVDRSVAIGRSAKNPNVLNNVLVNKTKAAKNGAIILLDPQVWYLSGGGIISLNKMISEVEAAFTDKK